MPLLGDQDGFPAELEGADVADHATAVARRLVGEATRIALQDAAVAHTDQRDVYRDLLNAVQ